MENFTSITLSLVSPPLVLPPWYLVGHLAIRMVPTDSCPSQDPGMLTEVKTHEAGDISINKQAARLVAAVLGTTRWLLQKDGCAVRCMDLTQQNRMQKQYI